MYTYLYMYMFLYMYMYTACVCCRGSQSSASVLWAPARASDITVIEGTPIVLDSLPRAVSAPVLVGTARGRGWQLWVRGGDAPQQAPYGRRQGEPRALFHALKRVLCECESVHLHARARAHACVRVCCATAIASYGALGSVNNP